VTTLSELVHIARTRARLPLPNERRRIRYEAGVQARQVAEAVGVSTATVFDWERGRREPNDAHLVLYAEVLDALRAAIEEEA
jgi:DNA-binding transcriptional regulator YiaG